MTKEQLVGKIIVRPTSKSNGKKALLVFGILEYDNIEKISDTDECWVVKLTVEESIKWKNAKNSPTWNKSPEDILDDFKIIAMKEAWTK